MPKVEHFFPFSHNQDRNIKGVEVNIAKVMNMDPAFYTEQFEADY